MKLLNKMEGTVQASLQACVTKPLLIQEPMSKHTSFRIGGPADYFAEPQKLEELKALLRQAKALDLPITIIGNGTNLLVLDGGIRGLVVKLDFKAMQVEGDRLLVGSGVPLILVAKKAAELGLTGMEFAGGIPGCLGGAVYMNAGAYDGEMAKVVEAVTTLDPETGLVHTLSAENLDFSYRHCSLQATRQLILEVVLKLEKGDKTEIQAKMDKFNAARVEKQPLNYPSAGSTFKRPEGYFAAALIDQNGLKGLTVGGAQVSTKHAGFVINLGGATAKDVLELISKIQQIVLENNQVQLETEVLILGEA